MIGVVNQTIYTEHGQTRNSYLFITVVIADNEFIMSPVENEQNNETGKNDEALSTETDHYSYTCTQTNQEKMFFSAYRALVMLIVCQKILLHQSLMISVRWTFSSHLTWTNSKKNGTKAEIAVTWVVTLSVCHQISMT